MIKKISYSEIDFEKYKDCLINSKQQTFYAKADILNFLCEAWELLVYADYQHVMPIPLKMKLGFKVVLNPLFCQQLGIYGPEDDSYVNSLFLNFFKKNYHYYQYPFNSENHFEVDFIYKKNYIILKTDYASQKKKYFKGRKSSVKVGQQLNFKIMKLNDAVFQFIQSYFKGLSKASDIKFLLSYLNFLEEKKFLKLYGALSGEQLQNLAIVVQDGHTNYLLGLINHPEYLKNEGASFLIDQILQKEISSRDFSFMGSSIPGIELFFKSFGAELKSFPVLQNNKKELLMSYCKRL